MARRTSGLRNRESKPQVDLKVHVGQLNYHEGLSFNQVTIILCELGLDYNKFGEWLYGQTCPLVERWHRNGKRVTVTGVYEWDLFRWIANQKKGTPLIWD